MSKPSIRYRGDDADWIGRKYDGTIYGEGTAQPVDNWDCNERGVEPVTVTSDRRGRLKVTVTGPRKLVIPEAGRVGMRVSAQPGQPPKNAEGPQTWAEESE